MRRLLVVLVLLMATGWPCSAMAAEPLGVLATAVHVSPWGVVRPLVGARLDVVDLTDSKDDMFVRYRATTDVNGEATVKFSAGHVYVWAVDPPLGYGADRCWSGINAGYGGNLSETVLYRVEFRGVCDKKGWY